MADLSQLSKEAKESFLNSRMEEIKRKNEELLKRHAEVEADKKNAELNSNAAYMKKSTVQGGQPEKPARPPSMGRGKRLEKVAQEKLRAPEFQRRQQRLSEDENPPPDPAYNFLHDRAREGKEAEDRKQNSRRHISNYGGQDFANVRNTMQIRKTHEKEHPLGPPKNKMELTLRMTGRERKEYENWRIEREKIEEDRISRQKTATGEWRREWDKDKIVQEENESSWHSNGYRGRGRGGGRGYPRERGGGRNYGNSYQESSQSQSWHNRGGGRGGYQNRRRGQYNNQYGNDKFTEKDGNAENNAPYDAHLADRKVLVDQDSLKISFSNSYDNEEAAETPKPANKAWQGNQQQQQQQQQQQRRVGSGRILSSSSQSEDEKPSRSDHPYRRGKSQRGQFWMGREDGRDGRGRKMPNRGGRRNQGEHQYQQRSHHSPNESAFESPRRPDVESKPFLPQDQRDQQVEIKPQLQESSKDAEEIWETGDESWEDLPTSGNESLELSGPVDEGPSSFTRSLPETDSDIDAHLEKLETEKMETKDICSSVDEGSSLLSSRFPEGESELSLQSEQLEEFNNTNFNKATSDIVSSENGKQSKEAKDIDESELESSLVLTITSKEDVGHHKEEMESATDDVFESNDELCDQQDESYVDFEHEEECSDFIKKEELDNTVQKDGKDDALQETDEFVEDENINYLHTEDASDAIQKEEAADEFQEVQTDSLPKEEQADITLEEPEQLANECAPAANDASDINISENADSNLKGNQSESAEVTVKNCESQSPIDSSLPLQSGVLDNSEIVESKDCQVALDNNEKMSVVEESKDDLESHVSSSNKQVTSETDEIKVKENEENLKISCDHAITTNVENNSDDTLSKADPIIGEKPEENIDSVTDKENESKTLADDETACSKASDNP